MANNVGLTVTRGSNNAGPQQLGNAPKRNVGFIMARQRGPENVALPIYNLSDDSFKFGGYQANTYGAVVVRNFFKNCLDAVPTVYGVRVVGAGSTQASATTSIPLTVPSTLQTLAGQNGLADKGSWGNNLKVRLYHHGTKVKNNWVLEVYLSGVLVETWQNTTCMLLQNVVNAQSNYVILNFGAEPTLQTGTDTIISTGAYTGVGTISTISSPVAEVLGTATFTVTGTTYAAGCLISIYHAGILLSSYVTSAGDTPTIIGTALVTNLNYGASGYSATGTTSPVIKMPTGSGSSQNGTSLTIWVYGTANITYTGTPTVSGGVTAVNAATSATVTGSGTSFSSAPFSVGGALFTTNGQYIGKIQTLTSNTSLVLTSVANVALSSQGFIYVPFYYLETSLTGGTYVAPTENDMYPVTSSTAPKGLAAFDGVSVQLIANTEFTTKTMATQLKSYCETRRDCLGIFNAPYNASDSTLLDYATTFQASAESYIAGYNCWVTSDDGNGGTALFPSIGCVLGAGFIRTPYLYGDYAHIPPAGIDSYFVDCIAISPSSLSVQQLNRNTRDLTINSVVYQKGKGFYIATSRTYSTDSKYMSIHILIQTNMYVKVLQTDMIWTLQKGNTPELKKQIYSTLFAYFKTEYANGGIERSLPYTESVQIICDQSNNPATQDRKELNADVLWIPTDCTEAVKISLNRNDSLLLVKSIN